MSRFDPSQFIALVVDARHFERGLTLEHLRLMGIGDVHGVREFDKAWEMLGDGWTDAIDTLNPRGGVWTFWDYQAGAWQRDHGFRIDHLLLSPELADRMTAAGVDKAYRGREKASDHTPVWVEIGDL